MSNEFQTNVKLMSNEYKMNIKRISNKCSISNQIHIAESTYCLEVRVILKLQRARIQH